MILSFSDFFFCFLLIFSSYSLLFSEKPQKEKKPPVPLEQQILPAYQHNTVLLFEALSCIIPKNKAEAFQVKEVIEKRKV